MDSRSEDGTTGSVPENILRRVRALRARADHENTPAPEREASRNLAAELLRRYSINPDASRAAAVPRREPAPPVGWQRRAVRWVRFRLPELAVVALTLVLAAIVSGWFVVLTVVVVLLWAVHEYRARGVSRR